MKRNSEGTGNVQLVCKDCAPKSTEAWKDIKPIFLVGCFVKKGFPAISPFTGELSRETMWVRAQGVRRGKLYGELNNIPAFVMELHCGDTVSVAMKEIIEVLGHTGKTLKPKSIQKLETLNLKGAPRGRTSRVSTNRTRLAQARGNVRNRKS